ncbi:MAG: hypothetical protein AABX89_03810 [Candidatus Thermoplasmatota archaeon]
MTNIAALIGSQEMALIEALALNDHTGLTCPGIVQASGIPKSTVDRMVKRMESSDLLTRTGKRRKAPVFRLNGSRPEVVELARIVAEFPVRVYEAAQVNVPDAPTHSTHVIVADELAVDDDVAVAAPMNPLMAMLFGPKKDDGMVRLCYPETKPLAGGFGTKKAALPAW